MKNRNFWKLALGLGLIGIPFAGGCLQESPTQPAKSQGALTASAAPVIYDGDAAPGTETNGLAPLEEALPEAPALTNLAEARVLPISTNQPVPPKVSLSPGAAEIAKLAGSGVDQGVLLAYVTNSQSTFNLTAEEIIYLNDLGVPGPVVTSMIQRDQLLKEQGRNALLASSPPVTSLPAPVPAPVPAEPVSQPAPPPDEYPTEPPPVPPAQDATYATFYDSLAPYGSWVYVSGYGRCWRPTVVVANPGWQPYFDGGHWVYSDCGWYWMSDYSWGWAPFHYGRWFRHNHWGWCWAPDLVWGPSWVSWRYGDAYCGWAPLPPGAYFSFSFGLTWHGHRVHDWDDFGLHHDHYRFVAWRHFDDHHLHTYGVPPHQVDNVYRNTVVANRITVNNNTVINQGIPRDRVASETRHNIRPVTVRSTSDSERVATGRAERLTGNTLTVYRPAMPQKDPTARTASNSGRPTRGGFNTGGSAASALSAPLAERAPTTSTRSGTAPTRTASRPDRNPPSVVLNNPALAQDPPARNQAAPFRNSTANTGSDSRSTAAQAPAPTTTTRPSVPMRTPATTPYVNRSGGIPTQTPAPNTSRTVTAPPPSTWRNADPNARFDRVQPRTTDNSRTYSAPAPSYSAPARSTAPSYSAPARSTAPSYSAPSRAAEVPRYTPAPQRSYTPAPSYSRPESAPSRSYSSPAPSVPRSDPTPARSYSPAPSAPRSDPAPARSAPSSPSSSSSGGRNR